MPKKTYYPSFRVMDEEDAWDDHTQTIVNARLKSPPNCRFLTKEESDLLSVMCGLLVNDASPDVIPFVVQHLDHTLYSSPGEGERKAGVPAGKDLIRRGLEAMDRSAMAEHNLAYIALASAAQEQMLQDCSTGLVKPTSEWNGVPQQPFFQKLLSMTIEAYCSHPKIWSEIGYAGPAYPRGYVRAQRGQLDPWEAKTEQ